MRIATGFALVLLAGCSTISMVQDAWRWDATQPQPRTVLSTQEIVGLDIQVAELQRQRSRIRTLISEESGIWARQLLYADLHAVGMRLAPLERQLQAAAPRQ